jgi:hypothetical protein
MGTTHHGELFALGHEGQTFHSPETVTPHMLRELQRLKYHLRKKGGTVHIFGLLDNASPYGSYLLMEPMLRFILPDQSLAIHSGVWSPTPSEFRSNYNELHSLEGRPSVKLASLFPLHCLQDENRTEKLIDGLQSPPFAEQNASYPVHNLQVLKPTSFSSNDIFLILFAPSREQYHLAQTLQNRFPDLPVTSLPYDLPTDSSVSDTLAKSKHILALTNDRSYAEAYFGDSLRHPYFETQVVSSPLSLLEMLISPHFGYSSSPFRTIVLLDEAKGSEFDWLMASYLRKTMTKPFLFHTITPHDIQGVVTYSNRLNGEPRVGYSDVHWYGS